MLKKKGLDTHQKKEGSQQRGRGRFDFSRADLLRKDIIRREHRQSEKKKRRNGKQRKREIGCRSAASTLKTSHRGRDLGGYIHKRGDNWERKTVIR